VTKAEEWQSQRYKDVYSSRKRGAAISQEKVRNKIKEVIKAKERLATVQRELRSLVRERDKSRSLLSQALIALMNARPPRRFLTSFLDD
jgi:hypothetical protein